MPRDKNADLQSMEAGSQLFHDVDDDDDDKEEDAMFMDSEKGDQHRVIENIATLGFLFLHALSEADTGRRITTIVEN